MNAYNRKKPKQDKAFEASEQPRSKILPYTDEIPGANCPLCGKNMHVVNQLKEFNIQVCNAHGVFVVENQTRDTYVLEGFDNEMVPIKKKWYLIENHKPLTLLSYREMLKLANYRRLEKGAGKQLKNMATEE